ncbi:MAG: NAD-dependent epimerase/dehydratase family protein [Candidatus Omnitrophota bacterium]|nr:NAD-dependent epimerase/dehydratase family protein [Candidatus Omnitrophota bacterium]
MIAITGATGFIGVHLIKALQERGVAFRCLVRANSTRVSQVKALTEHVVQVDYSRPETLRKAFTGCDVLVHALGLINGSEEELREANIECPRRVFEAATKASVERVVFISSVAALRRHGPYGVTKSEGEDVLRSSGIPYIILRPAYVYGVGDENNTALMLRTLKRFPVIPVLGGGQFRLQPVYVDDVCDLIVQALRCKTWNRAYTVAGPEQITLWSMLKLLAGGLGVSRLLVPIPLKPVQALMRFYLRFFPETKLPAKQILELDKHEAFDISETQSNFNFKPRPFREGVEGMFTGDLCAAL